MMEVMSTSGMVLAVGVFGACHTVLMHVTAMTGLEEIYLKMAPLGLFLVFVFVNQANAGKSVGSSHGLASSKENVQHDDEEEQEQQQGQEKEIDEESIDSGSHECNGGGVFVDNLDRLPMPPPLPAIPTISSSSSTGIDNTCSKTNSSYRSNSPPPIKTTGFPADNGPPREWGVLPETTGKGPSSSSSSSIVSDKNSSIGDNVGGSGGMDVMHDDMNGLHSPSPYLIDRKRLSRHLSCGSSHYDAFGVQDIDTPLHRALSQLVKLRGFLSHLHPDVVHQAVEDLEHDEQYRDAETSSIYSATTSTLRRNSGLGIAPTTGSPYMASKYRRKRLSSPIPRHPLTPGRVDSSMSLQGYMDDENSTKGSSAGGQSSKGEDSQSASISSGAPSTTPNSSPGVVNRSEGMGSPPLSSFPTQNEVGEKTTQQKQHPQPRGEEEEDDTGSEAGDQFNVTDNNVASSGGRERSSSTFVPMMVLEQVIDTLLEPESLMKPVVHDKNDASMSWLRLVGSQYTFEDAPDGFLMSPMQHDATGEAYGFGPPTPAGRVQRQRSRISSDELSSIIITNTGKMMVQSSSQLNLADEDITFVDNDEDSSEEMEDYTSGSGNSVSAATAAPPPPGTKMPQQQDASSNLSTHTEGDDTSLDKSTCSDSSPSVSPRGPRRRTSTQMTSRTSSNQIRITIGYLSDWDFDAFQFAEETEGRPLYTLLWAVFTKHNFFMEFRIDKKRFKSFTKEVENSYLPLPYHNSIHAADVVASLHHLLFNLGMGKYLSQLESMAALIAAGIHDMKHPGRSNRFLIKARHPLSIFYNDQSVLEQMHLAEAFRLLTTHDILEHLQPDEWELFRALTIRMVLATDLKEHFQTVTKLRNLNNRSHDFIKQSNRDLILEVAIKVADIGHASKEFKLHQEWADRISEEFFQQGDHEKELHMPVSEFMDRDTPDNERNQVTFFEYIALPLFNGLRNVFPPLININRQARYNHGEWKRRLEAVA